MRFLLFLISLAPLFSQEIVSLRKAEAGAPPEQVQERGTPALPDRAILTVNEPTLTVYLPPKEKATGAAVVICPGGGYMRLAIDKEGHEVARWLNSLGIAGLVLKYRLPGQANMRPAMGDLAQARTAARVALEDAVEAMRVARANAAKWGLKTDRIGMMGFSAGGNLAGLTGMTAPAETRPSFLVLVYPALPATLDVNASTPPTLLVHADDDKGVNAAENSGRFYAALKAAGVPAEMHVYVNGGHGFGIRKSGKTAENWPAAFEAWFKTLP